MVRQLCGVGAGLKVPVSSEPIVIAQGDCLELLPSLPAHLFDAVITDPPYSSGGATIAQRAASPATKYIIKSGSNRFTSADFVGDNRDQRSWKYWCHLWLLMCLRTTRPGGYLLVFTDWRQLPSTTDVVQAAGWIWRGILPWDKGLGARCPHKHYFRHQCEYVVWGTNGPFVPGSWPAQGQGCYPGSYSFPVRQSDKHHMVGKPTQLMRSLMKCVPPGGLILDPFGGSGTTAVAAKLEGRRCLSIEFLSDYVEVAKQRLREIDSARAAPSV